jgi:hypothetical protein
MKAHDLIKRVHETYSQCKSYQDSAACSLTVALPEIRSIEELATKVGTLKHEYKRDKIFDMRWEWLPGDWAELSYEPGTFSAVLGAEDETFDPLATENLKANLLHGILTMETEEDIFLIKRLIFFGEAEFWLEDFYKWTVAEVQKDGNSLWHLKRVDKHLGDADIDIFVDAKNYTLASYESNAKQIIENSLAGSAEEKKEAHEMLFGDEPGPVSVIQKYQFKDVKMVN